MDSRDKYFYEKGYKEGLIKGQQIAQDILIEHEKTRANPRPIIILNDADIDHEKNKKYKHSDLMFLKNVITNIGGDYDGKNN